jgi:Fur family zinc uptake transcriptional regulator
MNPFQKPNHVHKNCVTAAQKRFERVAMTSSRPPGVYVGEVFEILLGQHRAFGAYEIAEILAEKGIKLQAIQIYRALDKLIELGNVHRIESRNAYIACHGDEDCKHPQLLICESCNQVAEINSKPITKSIDDTASASGFVLQNRQVELFGLCPSCSV